MIKKYSFLVVIFSILSFIPSSYAGCGEVYRNNLIQESRSATGILAASSLVATCIFCSAVGLSAPSEVALPVSMGIGFLGMMFGESRYSFIQMEMEYMEGIISEANHFTEDSSEEFVRLGKMQEKLMQDGKKEFSIQYLANWIKQADKSNWFCSENEILKTSDELYSMIESEDL